MFFLISIFNFLQPNFKKFNELAESQLENVLDFFDTLGLCGFVVLILAISRTLYKRLVGSKKSTLTPIFFYLSLTFSISFVLIKSMNYLISNFSVLSFISILFILAVYFTLFLSKSKLMCSLRSDLARWIDLK